MNPNARDPFRTASASRAIAILAVIIAALATTHSLAGPPGGDWLHTRRDIIFQSKELTIWLNWYEKQARMASSERFKALGMSDVLDYLRDMEGQEELATTIKGLGNLTDLEMIGLGHACRGYQKFEDTAHAFEDVVDLHVPYRNHLFHLIGEISEKATIGKGLANALDRAITEKNDANRMGLIGQLRAAREYVHQTVPPGTDAKSVLVEFEIPRVTTASVREVDFSVTIDGRRTEVEVKTNLAKKPSIDQTQIRKDILHHMPDGWSRLLYLYPSTQRDNLQKVRSAFLAQFDAIAADAAAGKIPDPFTGTTAAKARAALEKQLPRMVATFNLPELKAQSR